MECSLYLHENWILGLCWTGCPPKSELLVHWVAHTLKMHHYVRTGFNSWTENIEWEGAGFLGGCFVSAVFHFILFDFSFGNLTRKKGYCLLHFCQILSAWLEGSTQRLVYSYTMKFLFGPMDGAYVPVIFGTWPSGVGNSWVQIPDEKYWVLKNQQIYLLSQLFLYVPMVYFIWST